MTAAPNARATLIILCGLPGSGKTTRAKRLETSMRAVRFCPDEWMARLGIDLYDEAMRARIEGLQWEIGKRLLGLGQSVIIEWGTWGRSERDTLRGEAQALGAAVELHYLSADTEMLWERISRRGLEQPPITREQIAGWQKIFQAPTQEEMALFDYAYTETATNVHEANAASST